MAGTYSAISNPVRVRRVGIGKSVHVLDGPPIQVPTEEEFEAARRWLTKDREESMVKVVLVKDLAQKLGRDRSGFVKFLRANDIETVLVRDPKTNQQTLALFLDEVERVNQIIATEHEIVDP